MRGYIALLLAPVLASCVFIIRPEDQNTPQIVTAPLSCQVTPGQPTAHVYFSMRIERSTVNMEDYYANFMARTVLALAGAGVNTTQAVLVRADERPGGAPILAAWGCRLDSPEVLQPPAVLRWYATQETLADAPLGCVTDPLAHLGGALNEVVTQYPRGLGGTNGLSVFGGAPDVAVIVHLDPLPRRSGFDSPVCASAQSLAEVEPDGTISWLRYGGEDLSPDRVVHWFAFTPEAVDRTAFIDDCRNREGFPSHLLDLIEPSVLPVYGPLSDAVGSSGAGVVPMSFCRLLADDQDYLVRGAVEVAGRAGLDASEDQIREVLEGGLPTPDRGIDPELDIGGRPPG